MRRTAPARPPAPAGMAARSSAARSGPNPAHPPDSRGVRASGPAGRHKSCAPVGFKGGGLTFVRAGSAPRPRPSTTPAWDPHRPLAATHRRAHCPCALPLRAAPARRPCVTLPHRRRRRTGPVTSFPHIGRRSSAASFTTPVHAPTPGPDRQTAVDRPRYPATNPPPQCPEKTSGKPEQRWGRGCAERPVALGKVSALSSTRRPTAGRSS
jgi:hypothetical protein